MKETHPDRIEKYALLLWFTLNEIYSKVKQTVFRLVFEVLQRKVARDKIGQPEARGHGIFLQPRPSGKETKKTMPKTILPESCRTEMLAVCAQHTPECNLSKRDVECFSRELTKYMKQFAAAFQRVEQVKRSKAYVHGLLGNALRKNVEQMALAAKVLLLIATLFVKAQNIRARSFAREGRY